MREKKTRMTQDSVNVSNSRNIPVSLAAAAHCQVVSNIKAKLMRDETSEMKVSARSHCRQREIEIKVKRTL